MKPPRFAKSTRARAWFPSLGAVLFLLGAAAAAPVQSAKVGLVDISKVLGAYYRTRDINQQLVAARQGARKELDERLARRRQMLDDTNVLGKAIEKAVLSPEVKSEQLKKRDDKVRELRRFEQSIEEFKTGRQQEMKDLAARTRNQIVEEIMVVIDAMVKSENYDLIFNKSAQGLGGMTFVVSGNARLDMTDAVIAALNKGHPAATPDPSPTAAPEGSPEK